MNTKYALSLISVVALLPGCAGYKSAPLKTITPIKKDEGNVYFSYQVFTPADSVKYLGKDTIKAGYQPIQITIENNTNHNVLFTPQRISLPCVSADIVAKEVHDSSTTRAAGWGITGLFIPVFLIPAIVDTCWSVDANKELDIDYQSKSTKEQIIHPRQTLNGVVFVPTDKFSPSFDVTLVDEVTGEKIICES